VLSNGHGSDRLRGGGLGGSGAWGGAAAAPQNPRAATLGADEVLCVVGGPPVSI
jgi:hypothetical protein